MFRAAIFPGAILVCAFILYVLVYAYLKPKSAPALPESALTSAGGKQAYLAAFKAIAPPLSLIFAVLGSIFYGIATPTESSAIGGVGAIILALIYKQCSWKVIWDSSKETVKVTAMGFAIFVGATAFSMVFSYTGGEEIIEEIMFRLPGENGGF